MSEKCKACGDRLFDEDGQSSEEAGYCWSASCQCKRAESAESALAEMTRQRDGAVQAQVDMARAVRESYPDVFKDDEDTEYHEDPGNESEKEYYLRGNHGS